MKKIGLILVITAFSMKVSAQTAATDTLKFASNQNQISTFLKLMQISGLDTTYASKPITIFAPDNKAFEKLPAGMLDSLSKPANKAALINFLNNHIISGQLSSKQLALLIHKSYLVRVNTGSALLTTTAGNNIAAKINVNRNIAFVNKNGEENVIKQFDIPYRNMLFFIISSVILPEK